MYEIPDPDIVLVGSGVVDGDTTSFVVEAGWPVTAVTG